MLDKALPPFADGTVLPPSRCAIAALVCPAADHSTSFPVKPASAGKVRELAKLFSCNSRVALGLPVHIAQDTPEMPLLPRILSLLSPFPRPSTENVAK